MLDNPMFWYMVGLLSARYIEKSMKDSRVMSFLVGAGFVVVMFATLYNAGMFIPVGIWWRSVWQ